VDVKNRDEFTNKELVSALVVRRNSHEFTNENIVKGSKIILLLFYFKPVTDKILHTETEIAMGVYFVKSGNINGFKFIGAFGSQ